MLAVISPAKKMNFDPVSDEISSTFPEFQDQANKLAKKAKTLSASKLKAMMNLSDDLAKLNKERFQAFEDMSTERNSKQAMYCFAGDTYVGLDAVQFDRNDRAYAQDHLRILSGLYGVLRPLDAIQPYRLEMGRRLKVGRTETLYDFWGDMIGKALDEASKDEPIINLASNEYFKSAAKHVSSTVITPAFKEERGDKLQMIGFFAKKARGTMARFMIKNRIDQLDGLKDFDLDGYKFQPSLSTETNWTFTRKST